MVLLSKMSEKLGVQDLGDGISLILSFAVASRTVILVQGLGKSCGACKNTEGKESVPILNLVCLVKDTDIKFYLFSLPSKCLLLLAYSWLHPLRKRV